MDTTERIEEESADETSEEQVDTSTSKQSSDSEEEESTTDPCNTSMNSQDRNPLASYDITPDTGANQDISDESLNAALATSSRAQRGESIQRTKLSKENLDERLRMAQLIHVDRDTYSLPIDESIPTESIIFKDTDPEDPDISGIDNPNDDEEQSLISQVDPSVPTMTDPNQWIINALKTIHEDIQQIKPLVDQVPTVKTRVDEIQGVLGVVTSGFVEMKNAIKNMETTITQNRIEIAKLSDLIKAGVTPTPIKIQPVPKTIPTIEKTSEENLTKLINSISTKKCFSAHEEELIRNMLMIHDKEIIESTLRELGTTRPILGTDMDILIGINTGSSTSMIAVHNILSDLIVPQGAVGGICTGPCTPSPTLSAKQTPKSIRNPFKLKK